MTDTSYAGQSGFLAQVNPGQYGPGGSSYAPPLPAPINNLPTHGDPSQPAVTSAGYLGDQSAWANMMGQSAAQAANAPARIQNQQDIFSNSLGLMGAQANQQMQSGFLNQNYNLANAQNQLAMQGNQVDIGANARQPGYLTALHNVAGQQYDLSRLGEQTQADTARRGLESQLTGRGAFTSIGGQQNRFDIANQLLQQTQGTNLQQQGEGINFNEKMAQANDQKQQLNLKAQGLGISGDQLKASLDQGLQRLNLSTGMTSADLLNKINSGNLQDAAIGQNIYNQALQYSDYYQRSGLYQPTGGTMPVTGGPVYNPLTGAGNEQNYGGAAGGTMR